MRSPRALSSFVAISSQDLAQVGQTRVSGVLGPVCIGLWALGLWPTGAQPLLLGLAALTTCVVFLETARRRDALAESAYGERRRLIEALNRHRSRIGLERVIEAQTLLELEESASQWEQIESMLVTRTWLLQNNLREQVQFSADEYMAQVVAAHLIDPRSETIEFKSQRLTRLLRALENLDRAIFEYPRPANLSPDQVGAIPLLPSAELDGLYEALITSGN